MKSVRGNTMLSKTTALSKTVRRARVGLSLVVLMWAGVASADQVKILDRTGATRSITELQAGAAATVRIALKEGAAKSEGIEITLTNEETASVIQKAATDAKGVANFLNVQPGTYKLGVADSSQTIADVQILKAPSATSKRGEISDSDARGISRAMYVAGASVVAGGIGVAIAGSDSGSDSTSVSGSAFNADVSGSGLAADGSGAAALAGGSDEVAAAIGPTNTLPAPNPGAASPAPTTINSGTTPTVPDANGGSGTSTPSQSTPTPPTPTSSPNPSS